MNQDPVTHAAIVRLGVELGPDVLRESTALFAAEQSKLAAGVEPAAADVPYGPHARHCVDVYAPRAAGSSAPILVWVHGGGFVRGDKRSPTDPYNAHVGRFAARHGFVGIVMNHRLAPEFGWPCGGEDVGNVVDWLKRDAARYGGDPDRIVLAGTSAGAVHIATYLQLRPGTREVRGAVLLSGLYGATPMDGPDSHYFGTDPTLYVQRASLNYVANSTVPLFVACAELDPPRFQRETVALLESVLRARGRLPRTHFASGHNHYTLAMHLGTTDTRLADEILDFARTCCAA